MLNPDWPLALRLLVAAVPFLAAMGFFSFGYIAVGVIFTALSAYVFNALFMAYPGGRQ